VPVREAGVLDASVSTKVALAFAAALAMIGAVNWFSYRSDLDTRDSADWVAHTLTVEATLEALGARVADAETSARGYALTGSRGFLQPYDSARESVPGLVLALRKLTMDDLAQRRRLDMLEPLVLEKLGSLSHLVATRRLGMAAAGRFVATGRRRRLMTRIRGAIADMEAEEGRLLGARTAALAASQRRSGRIDLAGSVLAAILLGAAMFVILADLRALRDARARVKTLTGLLPICSNCKKVRDDRGEWHEIESFVESRSHAEFSHGVCPDCAGELYPDDSKAAAET
jgi:CHASE3 domain sensor protein